MNAPKFADLRARLAAFQLDDPTAAFPFSARLARENGWSRAYALRVVEEYKRFVLLCQISDRPPCPSEQVDEAWHRHLTFTRSYWTELCGRVLQRPLHHEPTRGGSDEHAKHVALYEHTLALYRATFAEEPPREIWPPASIRFGADTEHRKVNLRRNWVIPNPWARLRSKYSAAAFAVVPMAAAAWNPFDWQGPAFLGFFATCYVIALVLGIVLRKSLRPTLQPKLDPPLTPVEVAQLARGKRGAITATLSQLVSKDVLRLQETETTVLGMKVNSQQKLVGGTGHPADPLEAALTKAILANPNANLKELNDAAGDALDRTEAELTNRGLVYEAKDVFLARFVPAGLMAMLLLLGVGKTIVGVWRDKPVAFLIMGCIAVVITLFLFARNIRRSKAGDELVQELQAKHAEWKTLGEKSGGLSPAEIAFAVALFGTGALAGGAYANLNHWERQSFGNVGSDSSGSGCSSGCGGGGCGGGGCGGGGCGGCGGGD